MKSLKATLTESIIHENLNESAGNYAKYSDDLVKAAIAYTAGCNITDVKKLSNEAKGYSYQLGHSSTFKTVSYAEVNQIIDVHKNSLKKTFNITEDIEDINEAKVEWSNELYDTGLADTVGYSGEGIYGSFDAKSHTQWEAFYPDEKWPMSDGNKYDDKHAIIMSDEGHIYGVEKSKINKQQFKKLFDAFAKSEDISYLKTNCKDLT